MKSRSHASRTGAARKSAPRHGRATNAISTATAKTDRRDVPIPRAAAPDAAERRGCRMSRRTLALADLKLRQIEDAFLDTLLDAHPRQKTALDRLLDDLAAAPAAQTSVVVADAVPEPDQEVAAASARRIESSLVAAVIEHHPRRDRALDRLLNDLAVAAPAAAHGAWVDEDGEEHRRASYDASFDTDFDGLG